MDLFSGAGGLSEGLRQASFDVIAAADHDPDACATYRGNLPHAMLVEGDLTARENHEALIGGIEAKTGAQQLDLLAGGPPCQAFSKPTKAMTFSPPRRSPPASPSPLPSRSLQAGHGAERR